MQLSRMPMVRCLISRCWITLTFMVCIIGMFDSSAAQTSPNVSLPLLKMPAGFSASLYHPYTVPNARSLVASGNNKPGGPIITYVSTWQGNKVYALVDKNGDGVAEQLTILKSGLFWPNGIAWRNNSLYVTGFYNDTGTMQGYIARWDNIDTFALNNQSYTGTVTNITKQLPSDTWHGWRYIAFGPDDKLYCAIGAPFNIGIPPTFPYTDPVSGSVTTAKYASIVRMNPDGTGFEVFATGVRNCVGFDWHPETGDLWFTDNGRDLVGDNLPDCELNRARQPGLFFGYPYCHSLGVGNPYLRDVRINVPVTDPDFNNASAVMDCQKDGYERTMQPMGPHFAPLGARFYRSELGGMFPPAYNRTLFVAIHGSWNRALFAGYKVMAVQLDPANSSVVSYTTFMEGFLQGEGTPGNRIWGRPVALLQLQDGSLLLSDDYAGAVYRITWSNIPKPPSPVIVPSPPGAKPVPSPPVAGKTVNVNWIYSATAYTPISLNCSDRLMFNWNSGSHNIIFDTTGDCNSMGSTYAGVTTSGAVPWTATSNGKFYFKCTVGDHCVGGNMNLAVTVTGCGAQPPSPPVARSPPPYPYTGKSWPVNWKEYEGSVNGLKPINATCGDRVVFTWSHRRRRSLMQMNMNDDMHDIYMDNADNCVFNGGTQLFPAKLTATYTWIATSPGTYYFKCTVTDHCKSGKMKQKVTVVCPAAVKPKATVKSAAGVLTAAEFVHSG